MTTRRSLALGAAGVTAGLALGVTGLASAADPTPSPDPARPQLGERFHKGPGGPGLKRHGLGGPGGLVTAVDRDSLTVSGPRGTETIALTSATTYYEGSTKATRGDIDKGDIVHVRLTDPRATSKTASVVTVLPAHLGGWVTKVDGDSFTLVDHSGFTRVIRTSSSTTYEKDGESASRSAITVGSMVRAVGEVASDGTTLDASRVMTGRPAKADRRGGPMGETPMGAPDA